MIPDFAGARISKVSVEHMLRFWTDSGWQFNLEGNVHLEWQNQPRTVMETTRVTEGTPPELAVLVEASIEEVRVSKSGQLTVRLERGQLDVPAEEDYEAWQIHGPRGEMVICMPGGELAIWGARTT